MFNKKCEPKRYPSCVILAVGALAAVGVCSIIKCSKCTAQDMKTKMEDMLKRAKSTVTDMASAIMGSGDCSCTASKTGTGSSCGCMGDGAFGE